MKVGAQLALIVGLLSSIVTASEYSSSVENVDVIKTEISTLSIQNHSFEDVAIELYGEAFNFPPNSGLQFECLGYQNIQIQIKNNDYEYFEVPCQSRVVFTELFKNKYAQGE